VRSWIEDADGLVEDPSPPAVAERVAAGTPFWLDIEAPTDEVIDGLAEHLGLHPLAVEDSKRFGRRGQLHIYGNVATVIASGLDRELRELVEVHCYYTTGFLITLHRVASPALEDIRRAESLRPLLGGDPVHVLHHVIRSLHTPFQELVSRFDERLYSLEQQMLHDPDEGELAEISAIRHRVSVLRRALAPGLEAAGRLTLIARMPGASESSQLYAQDIGGELQRIVADLIAIGERCVGLFGLHASIASNRQAVVSRRLAAVATIFLPISFVVGFFGQNFSVLTDLIEEGWVSFVVLGLLLNVICVVATVLWLGRKGWR
jgi:magnesium transporter